MPQSKVVNIQDGRKILDIEAALHFFWGNWTARPQQGCMSYDLAMKIGVPKAGLIPGAPVEFRTDRNGLRHYSSWMDPDEAV